LIKQGVNINWGDGEILKRAVSTNINSEMIKFLISRGADARLFGKIDIENAYSKHGFDFVNYLAKNGADVTLLFPRFDKEQQNQLLESIQFHKNSKLIPTPSAAILSRIKHKK
jgi:GTP-binding protein EngB required for normal cell division